jgi:butyryl-CoA dehydrogenase
MVAYDAPIEDMQFVTRELLAEEFARALPGMEEFSDDVVDAILEEASRFASSVLQPINRSGDEEGCRYDNGVVRTPAGFKEAFAQFCESGWNGLNADPAFGGQGAPESLGVLVHEMLCGANLAFSMYPALTNGCYRALHTWGDETQKQVYLPQLVSGRWTGTMCLTEPQCGTDLSLIRTRAEPRPDGSYGLTGTKIFISAGEHDLAENIVHLVLARTPDAPDGIRGISLFVVPKFLPAQEGGAGERNSVRCGAIEHKMGINASATCVMNFDDATGYRVGPLHKGMRAMFTFMNAARLEVGVQGLAVAEASYQGAVAYARERLQGRALSGPRSPELAADSLLVHPDVRRMLLTMRAQIEGGRALVAWVANASDVAERDPDPQRRQDADEFVSLLIPVVKAWLTDLGSECANVGLQVFGGHGYIRDHGIEQFVRDARITQIYEGANGVQAMDLVGRKLPAHTGRYLRHFFHPLSEFLEANAGDADLAPFLPSLGKAFTRLQRATAVVAQRGLADPDQAAAVASEYLRLFALVAVGYLWARAVHAAARGDGGRGESFYRAKVVTARVYYERILPQSSSLFTVILAGGDTLRDFDDDAF